MVGTIVTTVASVVAAVAALVNVSLTVRYGRGDTPLRQCWLDKRFRNVEPHLEFDAESTSDQRQLPNGQVRAAGLNP